MSSLPDFLQPLEFVRYPFPRAALEVAVVRREESTPHLLHALEWADQHHDEVNRPEPPYQLHFFALFLLAQFRETRALPLVIRLFRHPKYDDITGDLVTESFPSILASVCGGDIAPIQALIEDPAVDEWVRGAGVDSLVTLVCCGALSREAASAYFGELFHGRLERKPDWVWNSLIDACTNLRFPEHRAAIRDLYQARIADPTVISLGEVKREISQPFSLRDRHLRRNHLIDDAIAEMAEFDWSEPKPPAPAKPPASFLGYDDEPADLEIDVEHFAPDGSVRRAEPKIGRNDLCPCGSGKKYKKCCGRAVAG